MNKNSGIVELTQKMWSRRRRRVGYVECYKCEDSLRVGQTIFSRSATMRLDSSHYKWYCMECAEALYFVEAGKVIA